MHSPRSPTPATAVLDLARRKPCAQLGAVVGAQRVTPRRCGLAAAGADHDVGCSMSLPARLAAVHLIAAGEWARHRSAGRRRAREVWKRPAWAQHGGAARLALHAGELLRGTASRTSAPGAAKRAYATRMPCEYLIAGVQPAATRSRLRPATCARRIRRDTHAAHSSDREVEAPRCSCTMTGVSTRTVSPLATSCVTTRRPSTTFTAAIEKTRCGLRPPPCRPAAGPSFLGSRKIGATNLATWQRQDRGALPASDGPGPMQAGLGRRRHPRSGNQSGR